MAYTQEENEKYQPPELEPRPQQPIDKIEILFDKVAIALIESEFVDTTSVENNQKFIREGLIQTGQGAGILALFQKDIKANQEDLKTYGGDAEIVLKSYLDEILDFNTLVININQGLNYTISINMVASGLPENGYDITEFLVQDGTFSNVSQFIPLQQSSSIVDVEKAEEYLDTNIFELLPSGDARQNRIIKFFEELNALLPNTPPEFDLNGDGYVDRAGDETWLGDEQYSQNNSISYAQDNPDESNINEEDAYFHRLKKDSGAIDPNNTNESLTIEDIYNVIAPYLTDILESPVNLQDDRPEYENQSGGYLQFRNPNQGIIVRNTNQEFVEGLNPSDLTYLNTDGTGGFTITMWVRFLDKVSEGTLFNFGNPLRDENPFGFKLETFVLNKNERTYYTSGGDGGLAQEGDAFYTWGSTVENTSDLSNQGIFGISNSARFVRLQVKDGFDGMNSDIRDSHVGNNSIRKISWNYPELTYRDGVSNSSNLRLINSTFIPEDFNEWYFICASYNPNVIEPNETDIEPDVYNNYNTNTDFWLNHIDPYPLPGNYTSFSNRGNKCKVEIISKTDLLRARGFKVD